MKGNRIRLAGKVTHLGRALSSLRVEIWDLSLTQRLEEVRSGADGHFEVLLDPARVSEAKVGWKLFAGKRLLHTGSGHAEAPIEIAIPATPSPAFTHPVAGVLTDAAGRPLAGYTVRGVDLDGDARARQIGYSVTDAQGRFGLAYVTPDAQNGARRLRLQIDDAAGRTLDVREVQANGQSLAVAVNLATAPSAPTLREVGEQLNKALPAALLTQLADKGVHTLDDVRRVGGTAGLGQLAAAPADLAALDAHADLYSLSPDVQSNAKLIANGYRGVVAIARASRGEFVAAVAESIGAWQAARLHAAAVAQAAVADGTLMELRVAHANGRVDADGAAQDAVQKSLFPDSCSCDDCQAAVSPLAYLADLVAYTTQHVKSGGKSITLDGLTATFLQPFDKLPTSCESMDALVHQVRLCAEVLRGRLAASPPSPASAAKLAERERQYVRGAYESLLDQIGTTFDELRLAVKGGAADQDALAARLGLEPAGAALKALLIDPSGAPADNERRLEQLFGLADTHHAPLDALPKPDVESWRDLRLRTQWNSEDWPSDDYQTDAVSRRPIVDPDLIGPDDFRTSTGEEFKPGTAAARTAIALWMARRQQVDGWLADLAKLRASSGKTAFEAVLGSLFGSPLPDLDGTLTALSQGDPDEVKAAVATVTAWRLSVDSFSRLMALRDQLAAARRLDPAADLRPEEWHELDSIAAQARKRARFSDWLGEETDVKLGAPTFWLALSEPTDGDWPPLDEHAPWIDPDLVQPSDLPEGAVGRDARKLLAGRQQQMKELRAKLDALRNSDPATGFDKMIRYALGSPAAGDPPAYDLDALLVDLNGPDAAKAAAAATHITTDLWLTVESFTRLMTVREAAKPGSPVRPTAADLTEVDVVLASAAKELHLYKGWLGEEHTLGMAVAYWRALKARRPRWRSDPADRKRWQAALRERDSSPLVDPDLIGPADLARTDPTDAAYKLWAERAIQVTNWNAQLADDRASHSTNPDRLAAMLARVLIAPSDLAELRAADGDGADLRPRLDQLRLDPATGQALMKLAALVDAGAELLDSEWTDADAILTQVRKRLAYADWRNEERTVNRSLIAAGQPSLLLDGDYFQIAPPPPFDPAAVPTPPADNWRAPAADRQRWLALLQARLDQERAVGAALRDAVSATEEATLPDLRDALVDASEALGADVAARASWLTGRLLIDAQGGGCLKTTRVAQAIETLQTLLWGLRTEQIAVGLTLDADQFDAEWVWMGTYASWRAAMFVVIYPENLLLPALRHTQTPGFRQLVESLRGQAQLTPAGAREAARTYADYFHDMCTLRDLTSCYAVTRIYRDDGGDYYPAEYRSLMHLLARGGVTNTVYWSTYDWSAPFGSRQSFWGAVPGLIATALIDATVYQRVDQRRFLYLFARTDDGGAQKLVFSRFDLELLTWEEPVELELPERATRFTARLMPSTGDSKPPRLQIGAPSGSTYIRSLAGDGDDWAPGDWIPSGNAWGDWTPLPSPTGFGYAFRPGIGAAPITAVARDADHVDLFVVGDDQQVYTIGRDAKGTWGAWTPIPGLQINVDQSSNHDPIPVIAAVARDADHIDLFATGQDTQDHIYTAGWSSSGGWTGWTQLGDLAADTYGERAVPAAVARDADHIDLFVQPNDAKMYTLRWRSGTWDAAWAPVADTGGPIANNGAHIAAVARDDDHLDVLLTGMRPDGSGTTAVITSGWRTGAGFRPWSAIGTTDMMEPSVVAVVARTSEVLVAFVTAKDGSSILTASRDSDWNEWTPIPDPYSLVEKGAVPLVVKRDNGFIHVFARGASGGIYTTWSASDGVWQEWVGVAAADFAAGSRFLTALATPDDHLELYAFGTDGRLYTNATAGVAGLDWILPPEPLAPKVSGPFDISERLPATKLQFRRGQIAKAFADNADGPAANLVYLQEAYYFVPVHLAVQLQAAGQYESALDWFRTVYDWSAPLSSRKIYYGLTQEGHFSSTIKRAPDWLLDPLDPHRIAATRRNSYTRFTVAQLVRCLLEFADSEFTRDTAESRPRARTLYLTALDLLGIRELRQGGGSCRDLTSRLTVQVQNPQWEAVWRGVNDVLQSIRDRAELERAVTAVQQALDSGQDWPTKLIAATAAVAPWRTPAPAPTLGALLKDGAARADRAYLALLSDPSIAVAVQDAGQRAASAFTQTISLITGKSTLELERAAPSLAWLGGKDSASLQKVSDALSLEPPIPQRAAELRQLALEQALPAMQLLSRTGSGWSRSAAVYFSFCLPPNPVIDMLRLRAELNLYKLRNCRNFAGMLREAEPYSAPADTTSGLPLIGGNGTIVLPAATALRPTPYRYAALMARAKQLVQLAQQMEQALFVAIERGDAERYSALKARQDVGLAHAGIRLQDLRVREAQDGITLAELQQERAQIQAAHFDELLDAGNSDPEEAALWLMGLSAALTATSGVLKMDPDIISAHLSAEAQAVATTASIDATRASFERRKEDWELQAALAHQDMRIGAQQIKLAQDHLRVVGQERVIADMQASDAQSGLDFIEHKFTNAELYDWMRDVLQRVYRFFLQQATATAQLAADQLAFERQEVPTPFIQTDYWDPPADTTSNGAMQPDRSGLTGSARLLQDLTQLDQHAFATDQRKLQLTKTLSLAQLDPYAFQRFVDGGVLRFSTPMALFDRDFPGHYLRLIRRVRTTVVALLPPSQGIRATLSTSGLSRVVIGPDVFQTVRLNTGPQSVALSAAQNATGLFDLDTQPDLLLPFELTGVDTSWELRMPKASNPFDYRTIADVLFTIEYTALDSFDYRREVLQQLGNTQSGDQPFSFRHQFADAWYDLNNPSQSSAPMQVRFAIERGDFPPNLEQLRIDQVSLYFARAGGRKMVISVDALQLTPTGGDGPVGGGAVSLAGILSTRVGNAASWTAMIGKSPVGDWLLALPNTAELRAHFADEDIEDIFLIITFSAQTSAWPD
jgi:hypothetical protein